MGCERKFVHRDLNAPKNVHFTYILSIDIFKLDGCLLEFSDAESNIDYRRAIDIFHKNNVHN